MNKLLVILLIFLSACNLEKSNPFNNNGVQLSGQPAFSNEVYLKIINNVIKFHFNDSIAAHKAYYLVVENSITNLNEIDSSTTWVVCKSAKGDIFEFHFANYQKSYLTIIKNNLIIFNNTEFPRLPEIENMKFGDTGSNLLIY